MTMFNLGEFTNTLGDMQNAIDAQVGASKADGGWQQARAQSDATPVSANRTILEPNTITKGDGILHTLDIAQEHIREGLSANSLVGAKDLWFDGVVHRQLNPRLEILRNILTQVEHTLCGVENRNNFLLHVNDLDVNAAMLRPKGQNFSYFASMMSVIDPRGFVHFLSMDRVRTNAVHYTGYAWRAVAVENRFEMSIQHDERNGRVSHEPATAYICVGEMKIAVFTRKLWGEMKEFRGGLVEYAYRETARETPMTVRPLRSIRLESTQ